MCKLRSNFYVNIMCCLLARLWIYACVLQLIITTANACGGVLTSLNGTITSPFHPLDYPRNARCTWEIACPDGYIISVQFTHFDLPEKVDDKCTDHLTLLSKEEDGKMKKHDTYCGSVAPAPPLISTSNVFRIVFYSSKNQALAHSGFSLSYSAVKCGGKITSRTGTLTSPFYPSMYPPGAVCTWDIEAPENHNIALKLNFLEMEARVGHSTCNDKLEIFNKLQSGTLESVGTYCEDDKIAEPILSKTNKMRIVFSSNNGNEKQGFSMDYYTDLTCGGVLIEPSGVIKSPFYPYLYPPGLRCTWEIQVPSRHKIFVNFTEINLQEAVFRACKDFVAVFQKDERGQFRSRREEKFCGTMRTLPGIIKSDTNSIQIRLTTDARTYARGFAAEYYTEDAHGNRVHGNDADKFSATCCPRIKSYAIDNRKAKWFEAMKLCQRAGMELAAITDKQQNGHLMQTIQADPQAVTSSYWLAGTRYGATDTDFVWFSGGERLNYSLFGSGEGYNRNEMCIKLYGVNRYEFYWGDDNCDTEMRFVCQSKCFS